MTSADTTLDSASGGDRFHDRRTNLRRRNIEALATSNAINAIQRRVSRVGQIDRRLLAREQECEGFGVDPYVDQPFNRPGAYDRRHRYTENSISQALRHTLRRKVGTSCHYREWHMSHTGIRHTLTSCTRWHTSHVTSYTHWHTSHADILHTLAYFIRWHISHADILHTLTYFTHWHTSHIGILHSLTYFTHWHTSHTGILHTLTYFTH